MTNAGVPIFQSYRVKSDNHFSASVEVIPRNGETFTEASDLEERLNTLITREEAMDKEIGRLTTHADALDYMLAASGGILAGIIDIFLVGKPGSSYLTEWSDQQTLGVVKKFAKMQGWKPGGGNDSGAIAWLEKKYKVNYDFRGAGDIAQGYTDPAMHHLNSWAHHPTLLGLVCSIIDQFNNTTTFTSAIKAGVGGDIVILSGNSECPVKLQGRTVPAKIISGAMNWVGHLMSDVAGSSSAVRHGNRGAGIPGPIMSMVYEISSIVKESNISPEEFERNFLSTIEEMYRSGYDFRFELAQAVPVIFNDLFIRSMYIIRRYKAYLVTIKSKNETFSFKNLWHAVKPFKNRTITRMLLIGEAVFTIIDVSDAAVRSAGNWTAFLLRINIVGVGKLVITGVGDAYAGVKKERLRDKRILLMNELIMSHQGIIEYKIADLWLEIPNTIMALQQAELGITKQSQKAMQIYQEYELTVQPKLNHEIKKLTGGEREVLSNFLDI